MLQGRVPFDNPTHAMNTDPVFVGIDVAKDELVICDWPNPEDCIRVENQSKAIRSWLRGCSGPVRIAIEPTSTYHLACVDEALKLGYEVYLVNPRQLVHYREAVNLRNKTDPADAYLLARYLAHEADQLKRYQPQPRQAQHLWALMKRRALVVQTRKQLKQSLDGIKLASKALFQQIDNVLKRIDHRMRQLIRELGWWTDYQRCRSIPGIGPLNAMALTVTYHRGAFSSVDAFISFIGFDVRIRESGRFKGKRKLTIIGVTMKFVGRVLLDSSVSSSPSR